MSTIISNLLSYIWQPDPPTEKIIETDSDPMFYSSIVILTPPPNNNSLPKQSTSDASNASSIPSQNELP